MTKKQRTGTAPERQERQKETAPRDQTQRQTQSQGPSQSGTGRPLDRDPEEEGSAGREPDAREAEEYP
jgi:hypothetical protein